MEGMVKKPRHLHTYERIRDRPDYYRCIDPHCRHYIHKSLLLGKAAHCKYCGEEYTLTKYSLKLKVPHCDNCTTLGFGVRKPKPKAQSIAEQIAGNLFSKV